MSAELLERLIGLAQQQVDGIVAVLGNFAQRTGNYHDAVSLVEALRELQELRQRAYIIKFDDKCGRVLWHLHNGEVSVGKAAEWMREYILTGKEGPLPPGPLPEEGK